MAATAFLRERIMPVPLDPPKPKIPRRPVPPHDHPLRTDPTRRAATHEREGATPQGPRLPHERDQHRDTPDAPRPEMIQADADLRAGLEDTDCRNQAAATIERAGAKEAAGRSASKR